MGELWRYMRDNLVIPLAALAVLFALLVWASCTDREVRAEAPAPRPAGFAVDLAVQQPDTFNVAATWAPVEFEGDTIRSYRRSVVRTDTAQDLSLYGVQPVDTISAVGSEVVQPLPAPGEGETGSYRYCLKSVRSDGVVGRDSTCAVFDYTAPVSYPPPPDSLEVSPSQAVILDSLRIVPDALAFRTLTEGGVDSTTERVQVYEQPGGTADTVIDTVGRAVSQLAALMYLDGDVVGCAGACDTIPLSAAGWDDGAPVQMVGRPGYEPGSEWMARRLPWLRHRVTVRWTHS